MINLLPPSIKEEIAYSKRNTIILRYVWLAAFVAIFSVGALLGAQYYVSSQIASTKQQLEQKENDIAKYHKLEQDAKSVNARLTSIQTIQKNQSKFSVLLSDIAAATPVGVAIGSISFTGDDKRPVDITATASSYKAAVSFRDALVKSPRISAADIVKVGTNSVVVSVAFKAGQSR